MTKIGHKCQIVTIFLLGLLMGEVN